MKSVGPQKKALKKLQGRNKNKSIRVSFIRTIPSVPGSYRFCLSFLKSLNSRTRGITPFTAGEESHLALKQIS